MENDLDLTNYPILRRLAGHNAVHIHEVIGERCSMCDVDRELRALFAERDEHWKACVQSQLDNERGIRRKNGHILEDAGDGTEFCWRCNAIVSAFGDSQRECPGL